MGRPPMRLRDRDGASSGTPRGDGVAVDNVIDGEQVSAGTPGDRGVKEGRPTTSRRRRASRRPRDQHLERQARLRIAGPARQTGQTQRRPGRGHGGTRTGAPDGNPGGESATYSQRRAGIQGAADRREDAQGRGASATTARVRAARRARGGPGKDEAHSTTAQGQHERTAASTPKAQATRTEPPEESTAETTRSTGNGEPCREPAKATIPERGNKCWPEEIKCCLPEGVRGRGRGCQGRGMAGMEDLDNLQGRRSCPRSPGLAF